MRIPEKIRRGIHGQCGDAPLLQEMRELLFLVAGGEFGNEAIDPIRVSAPLTVALPARVVELGGMIFPELEKDRPVGLRHEDGDVPVLAWEKVCRGHMLVLASGALHHSAFSGAGKRDMLMERQARLDRCIDVNAFAPGLALPESEHHAVGSVKPRVVIGLRLGRHAGRKTRVSADVEKASHSGRDDVRSSIVGIGPALAKSGKRNEDKLWPAFAKGIVA